MASYYDFFSEDNKLTSTDVIFSVPYYDAFGIGKIGHHLYSVQNK